MPHEIIMPQLGMAQDSGVIVAWHKEVGEAVQPDDVLMEVETDKAVMEVPAGVAGYLAEIFTPEGEEAAIGATVAIVTETREAAETVRTTQSADNTVNPEQQPSPPAAQAADSSPVPVIAAAEVDLPETARVSGNRILASPKARRLARERGLDLAVLVQQGVREPVRAADLDRIPVSRAATRPSLWDVDHSAWGPVDARPVARTNRIAAERLVETWRTVVPVTHHDRADMTEIEAARSRLRSEADAREIRLTALAFHIKALAATLGEHPVFNASLSPDGETLWMKQYIHIGVVVDTDRGVVIPVIRDARQKGILAIAAEIQDLAVRARERKIRPDELGGASMSVSSLGREAGTGFTPVINAPEAAIMGISRTGIEPVWDGQVFQPRPMVPLDLTYDHRIVNGADAARFMTAYRRLVEYPTLLLL